MRSAVMEQRESTRRRGRFTSDDANLVMESSKGEGQSVGRRLVLLLLSLLQEASKAVQEHLHRDHYQQHAHQALHCDQPTLPQHSIEKG